MGGHLGFSYTGLIFLLLLFIPNIVWTKNKPQGYSDEKENKIFLLMERTGEIMTTICSLIFSDFNFNKWSGWSYWLIAAFILMLVYELWWVRYFFSKRTLNDFYSSFMGVPLAGATLPVAAFFLLAIYGKVIWLLVAVIILGIGHIGIHWHHKKEINTV